LNDWTFTVDNGTITISNPDKSISRSFPHNNVIYNETMIFDKETNAAKVLNQTQKTNNSIRYPYVIDVDKYLPIMRIYDQQKTLLNSYSVLDPQIHQLLETIACPEFSYSYQDKCLPVCPLNFYHYKNGTRGRCTLSPFPGAV
jgi:hypothetical protein